MKRIIVPLILVIFTSCAGTPAPKYRASLPPEDQTIIYIDEHPKNKADAYVAINKWVATNYVSAQTVIQMNDKEAGILILKSGYPFTLSWYAPGIVFPSIHNGVVNYTLTIQVKDRKIKMEFMTGDIRWNDQPTYRMLYFPETNMPELRTYYKNIHNGLLADLLKKDAGF